MDVLYKGGALLATQLICVARILLALPVALLHALLVHPVKEWLHARGIGSGHADAGCVFYEGVVTHARRRPVGNAFE